MKLVAPLRFQEFYFRGETYKEKESIVELEYWIEEAKELCKRVEFMIEFKNWKINIILKKLKMNDY